MQVEFVGPTIGNRNALVRVKREAQMTRNLLVVAVACALAGATARAQLRTDLIESARAEKEARLTPETPPKAERRLVWAENTLAYRLLTGDADGFGVSF